MKKGFTLIELLVVIAIIGILSSVVLASLNSARGKGQDAAIKANLNGARPQAELYYDGNANSYNGVCTSTTAGISKAVDAAQDVYFAGTVGVDAVAATYQLGACHDDDNYWVAATPLKASVNASAVLWCVDSAGNSKQVTALAGNATVCP